MSIGDQTPINIYCDNQSAIALARNPVQHQRSKHIDIKYHYIRSQIANSIVNISYIATDLNISDIFTKAVPRSKLIKFGFH